MRDMAREKIDRPHPTPHPDAPHISGPARDRGSQPGPESSASDRAEPEESNYDSCFDDLNQVLSDSHHEPDPILESSATSQSPWPSQAVPAPSSQAAKPPRTSEVFRAAVAAAAEAAAEPGTQAGRLGRAADPAPGLSCGPATETERRQRGRFSSESDQPAEPGIPWFTLLLLTYSSALTLALTWMFWTGHVFTTAEPPPASSPQPAAEPAARAPESRKSIAPLPPIPAENVAILGQTIRVGQLEVTPLAIVVAPVDLVRAFDPPDWRRDEAESLVLRLRLTNISEDQVFAPLEQAFVRDQTSPLDRSMISSSSGVTIDLYPLANDSEWSIQGQEFLTLKPGESVETIIASETRAAGRLAGEMTWRVHLRIGAYRTDMVGVRFRQGDLSP
jgi:hypothetical protein